jgi:hypothetical protein
MKWETAAIFETARGELPVYNIFHCWPLIHDTRLLERVLSLYHVTWNVPETHSGLVSMCHGKYNIEKDGRKAFYNAPKTAQCFAKGLIAARLPHPLEVGRC